MSELKYSKEQIIDACKEAGLGILECNSLITVLGCCQPEATKPAQDLSAAILALPEDEILQAFANAVSNERDGAKSCYVTTEEVVAFVKYHLAPLVSASPADALVAGDRETTTSDSENCAHLTNCPGCDKCDALLEHYMACDECGSWGNKEANGWTKTSENQFFCESCAAIQAQKDGHG